MQFGFGKVDITPRVGVQLYGYGPFLCRNSIAVREPLYARALAVSDGATTAVIVSCDLVGVSGDITARVREVVERQTGLSGEHVCVHCIHTHSGPGTKFAIGQGERDAPYIELLPLRIARACIEALVALQPATLSYATVPCLGMGYNREHDTRPTLDEALREDWRPNLPELTDTEAHVLRADGPDGLLGFATRFSCHAVVGPSVSRYIHPDWPGVATNWLEREHPGAIGLFLQGCEGNINSCVVGHSEQDSLLALDVIAARYARQVRPGLASTSPLPGDEVRVLTRTCRLSRAPVPTEVLREMLAEREAIIASPDASDADSEFRRAVVWATALRTELARQDAGREFDLDVELWGMRLGELVLVGAPFEIMLRYGRRVQEPFAHPTLVLSLCNDALGYAPERESFAQEGNYAARTTPYMLGCPPFSPDVEDELVGELTELAAQLRA